MLVTATMAIPAPLYAAPSAPAGVQGSVTDDIPVVLQPVQLKDGRRGYIAIVPYPQEQEAQVLGALARNQPDKVIFGFAGPDDPAIQAAMSSGNVSWMNTFIVANADKAPILDKAPVSLKQKLKDKFKRLVNFCKTEKVGFVTALVVSGALSVFIGTSASVPSTVGAFLALFVWYGWQSMNSEMWDGYLEHGKDTMRNLLTRNLGRDATSMEIQLSETAGKFHASYLANMGVASWILAMSGHSAGWNFEGAMQIAWYGYLGSTDVLDSVAAEKRREGRVGPNFHAGFIVGRILAATGFEIAGYAHVPHVQILLAGITTTATLYMAFSHQIDPAVIAAGQGIKTAAVNSGENIKNSMINTRSRALTVTNELITRGKTLCDYSLSKAKIHIAHMGEPAE